VTPPGATAHLALSRQSARKFADKWSRVTNEKQFAQSFWTDFFRDVIGIEDLLGAGIDFEYPIKNAATGTTNFIDVLWKHVVLIEHKSAGKSLDSAEKQAREYMVSLPQAHRPPVLFICDFARLRIVDVLLNQTIQFDITELPNRLDQLDAVFGKYSRAATQQETTADEKAASLMSELYVEFESNNYEGHAVSVLLIRLLFLMFADDTRMIKKGAFSDLLESSNDDGSGLGGMLQELFQVLDSPKEARPQNLPNALASFPYMNGGLFAETIPVFSFTASMRAALLRAAAYDWSTISPAIFGAMFQTIKSKEERRALGEHYTSITNILKVIRPLFLDDYMERLRKVWDDRSGLRKLRADLGSKRYLDPAAGSGNFLVVTYQRLRELEHKIIARLIELEGKATTGFDGTELQVGLEGTGTIGLSVTLEQFNAIEYNEWSSQIASVAMYLTDHQLNLQLDELTGSAPTIFPLTHSSNVVHGNALSIDWSDVCPIDDDTIIMGNPPFYGSTWLSLEQKVDQERVWGDTKSSGILDYVASWYLVAARHMDGTRARAAFVSTNSITQGQQPPVIWGQLYAHGMHIDFAHRTFAWRNDGGKNAAVHCVIVGFSANSKPTFRPLWSYPTVNSEPELVMARTINAYLLDADEVLVSSRSTPLQNGVQPITNGCKPVDGGYLSKLSAEEAQEIRDTDPIAAKYIHPVVGSEEFINNIPRFGLWLVGADPSDLVKSPVLKERVEAVRQLRLASTKADTVKSAKRPAEWQQALRQPTSDYLAVPRVSSYDRDYVPIGYMTADVLANDLLSLIPGASMFTFGILTSRVFNVWVMAVSGRLKSDPRLSNEVTYNNFPFALGITDEARGKVERAAELVLKARNQFPDSSLAVLYNRVSMPPVLRAAHDALDKAVLNAYALKVNATDVGILEKLFSEYASITNGLLAVEPLPRKRPARS
jgi:hypothetical protein